MTEAQHGARSDPGDTLLPRRESATSIDAVLLPKSRSSVGLQSQAAFVPTPRRGSSIGTAGSAESASFDSRRSTFHEHDYGYVPAGLHKIRQQPVSRATFSAAPSRPAGVRPASMTIKLPSLGSGPSPLPTGPVTPGLTLGEDLNRFPSESLHSFSFAQKSDEYIHTRNNILKKSIDILKDRVNWAAGGLGIINAQAKISGDQEVQSMMELLSKVHAFGTETGNPKAAKFTLGPVTGPADPSNENIFEKDFADQTESPTEVRDFAERSTAFDDPPNLTVQPAVPTQSVDDTAIVASNLSKPPVRATLKRTYTDIAAVSLKSKLTDVLDQPYLADESSALSPTVSNTLGSPISTGSFLNPANHAHGRGPPVNQAIFTTSTQPPWTIAAANDLACLTFGVSKAEIRKLGILDVVREDKRRWLEQKLLTVKRPDLPSEPPPAPAARTSVMGNGVTARLLSKPPSRESGKSQGQGRRVKSDSGYSSKSEDRKKPTSPISSPTKPQTGGVLLCGDVVPILKRDGGVGSATLWVQEKRGNLIWVLEEIAQDTAYVSVDEIGSITKSSGQIEAIWGMERVRRGMDITRILPGIPRLPGTNTGALDYEQIAELKGFTARTSNDISVPVTVEKLSDEPTFRVSSFPNVAGMLVVSAKTLQVSSSNKVISQTLFGRIANGLPITELIPNLDKMLDLLVEEENLDIIEGIVIPEHSFRRARAMLAMREGHTDMASIFLRPNGVPATHRDGAEIMVDITMRVVKSESISNHIDENVIEEETSTNVSDTALPSSEIVYALWVAYSRTQHAQNHGVGPFSPVISRPGTPPRQPTPGSSIADHREDDESDGRSFAAKRASRSSLGSLDLKKQNVVMTPGHSASSSIASDASFAPPTTKRTIEDYVILEDMGAGAYGQVKLARTKSQPSKKVVIKYVTKRRILVDTWTRDRRLGTVPLEIHVLNYLRKDGYKHPNIVEMSDFFEDEDNYYIEMVPHGLPGMDLFDYIELRTSMGEDEARRIFVQVASALEFLHIKAKVVHRDIKDENVILDGDGNIKLIDFGSASYIKNGPFDVFVGTIDYAAPEVLNGESYKGPEQDIWALGILLYTIIYKENPFYSIDEIMDHELRVPFVLSEESIGLVRQMLDRDVGRRIDITSVVNHAWCLEGAEGGDAS